MPEDLNPYSAKVISALDDRGELIIASPETSWDAMSVLISLGWEDEIKTGQRVLIFALGPEVLDPDNGASLGHFEVIRGEGRVVTVQARMAVVRSSRTVMTRYQKPVNYLQNALSIVPEYGEREDPAPFRGVTQGDFVRFI